MPGLGEMLRAAEPIEQGFAIEIGEDWLQGRTAYGGLTSAIALAVAQRVEAALPPLRSAQLAMIAPLVGRVEARARVVRKGRNVTWVSAELIGNAGVGFTASFAFMRVLEGGTVIEGYPMPSDVIPPDRAPPLPTRGQPAFMRNHFEVRTARVPEAEVADLCGWMRLRHREGLDPAVEAMLCGDALPAAVWPLLDYAVPISSMHWHVNVLNPASASVDGWWLLRSTSEAVHAGMASERIQQWNSAGVPVFAGLQSVAVFG